jgi:tetratricopeptide (TPR) repeat protein
MSRLACVVAMFLALGAPPAAAQTSNIVVTHYRAYNAALERGDLETAETEARAALNASETRDGDGGSTAVLALNLAHVLLQRNKPADAAAPAGRALALAQSQGEASRVDPLVAELAVQRAALPSATPESAEQFWFALLRAREGGTRNEPVYDAASDLGKWALARDSFDLAARAWRVASNASPGDDPEAILARAEALRALGTALLLRDIARNRTVVIANITRRSDASEADSSPIEPLTESVRITRPLAAIPGPDNALTNSQYSFALSLALLNASIARLGSMNGWDETPQLSRSSEVGGIMLAPANHAGGPLCAMTVRTEPNLRYPREAQNRFGVGSVVMRVAFGPDGALVSATPIATAGGEAFAAEARRVRWTAARADPEQDCTPPAVWLRSVTFLFSD